MSIQRLTAALGAAHVENTLALANLNFDFSLVRVDAPPEFRQLGANLSDRRRQEAESGTPHRTARKLGALFAGVLPSTPELTRAYGRRVSEISQSKQHNPKGNVRDGPFTAHIGADGTAIWAAATSGTNAIPILMLACLLARLWSGSEATALWVELVDQRRREIETKFQDDQAALLAAQQDILRTHLAEWDASARAWLQTADEVKTLQQTQLMLVINNLQLPVSNNTNVYQSVIESSRFALLSMEDLLRGQPQRVQSGAFLLGLSAWHLYPDMIVHGTVTRRVDQRDDLFPIGSLVTLGLESPKGIDKGVYWSLPLAHLRYYGDPVLSSRSTGHDSSRISIDQLIYVAIGSLFSSWVPKSQQTTQALSWFILLSDCLKRGIGSKNNDVQVTKDNNPQQILLGYGWLKLFILAAKNFPRLREHDKDLSSKLMALGHRRFSSFLTDIEHRIPQYFGLLHFSVLYPILRTDQERIEALRRYAKKHGLNGNTVIIKYRRTNSGQLGAQQDASSNQTRKIKKKRNHADSEDVYLSEYEYATAVPRSSVINGSQSSAQNKRHRRWIAPRWTAKVNDEGPSITARKTRHPDYLLRRANYAVCRCVNGCKPRCPCNEFEDGCIDDCLCSSQQHRCALTQKYSNQVRILERRQSAITLLSEECIIEHPRSFSEFCRKSSSSRNLREHEFDRMRDTYMAMWESDDFSEIRRLKFTSWDAENVQLIYGDPQTAALYSIEREHAFKKKNSMSLEDLEEVLQLNAVNPSRLAEELLSFEKGYYESYFWSLKAIASAKKIYEHFPEATVSLSIASRPLHKSIWAQSSCKSYSSKTLKELEVKPLCALASNPWLCGMSLASAFACIAMFESGSYDIDPRDLEHVFAMSSGNSLFVAAPLLDDPSKAGKEMHIERVIGNIGRAGIAMLIPPQDPQIRKPQLEKWELINHAPFDGRCVDSFQNTTHHLSFTQYTMPCNIGKHGAQDIEAFFIESLISVYDREKWIADLDVLDMFRDSKFRKSSGSGPGCRHAHDMTPPSDLIAIDNWEEVLDREGQQGVIRAFRNPVARLATAAVSVKKGYRVTLVPEKACWTCLTQLQTLGRTATFIQ